MWSTSPLNMFNVKYFLLDYLISFSEVFFFFVFWTKLWLVLCDRPHAFIISNTILRKTWLKLTKNKAKAKQHPEEGWTFDWKKMKSGDNKGFHFFRIAVSLLFVELNANFHEKLSLRYY